MYLALLEQKLKILSSLQMEVQAIIHKNYELKNDRPMLNIIQFELSYRINELNWGSYRTQMLLT